MQPHQQRVVDEKSELDSKIQKLSAFLSGDVFLTVNGTEQERLKRQHEVMTLYSTILAERIAAFE